LTINKEKHEAVNEIDVGCEKTWPCSMQRPKSWCVQSQTTVV